MVTIKSKAIPSKPRSRYSAVSFASGGSFSSGGSSSFSLTKDLIMGILVDADGVLRLDANLAVKGGITMHYADPLRLPTILDAIPLGDGLAIINGKLTVTAIGGIDTEVMWSALGASTTEQINKSHLTDALSGYALKNEIPSLSGYATETWVKNQGYLTQHQSLASYATETWVKNQGYLTQHQSLAGYATQTWVNTQIADNVYSLPIASGSVLGGVKIGANISISNGVISTHAPFELTKKKILDALKDANGIIWFDSNVAVEGGVTMHAVNPLNVPTLMDSLALGDGLAIINGKLTVTAIGGIDTEAMWSALGASTTEQINKSHLTDALSGYALKNEIPSLSGYATETWVKNQGYLTQHQSLASYATETWVKNQGYLTQHQSLASYATQTWSTGQFLSKCYKEGSCYSYQTGVFVTTSISLTTDAMMTVHIFGNGYGNNHPVDTWVQFYNYNSGNHMVNGSLVHNGANIGDIKVFNKDGKVCFWFKDGNWPYQTFIIKAYYAGNLEKNCVEKITNSAYPTSGVTRELTISSQYSYTTWNSNNYDTDWISRHLLTRSISIHELSSRSTEVLIRYFLDDVAKTATGWHPSYGSYLYNYASQKYLGIKDDGTPHYQLNTLLHAGNYQSYPTTKVGDSSIWLYPMGGNELNFGGDSNSSTIYFGYRATDSKPIPSRFVFGGVEGLSSLLARSYSTFRHQSALTPGSDNWYRCFESTGNNASGLNNIILMIGRSYNSPQNEHYVFSISVGYGGNMMVTQLSAASGVKLFDKIRIVYKNSSIFFIDIHYIGTSTPYTNVLFVSGIGEGYFTAYKDPNIASDYTYKEYPIYTNGMGCSEMCTLENNLVVKGSSFVFGRLNIGNNDFWSAPKLSIHGNYPLAFYHSGGTANKRKYYWELSDQSISFNALNDANSFVRGLVKFEHDGKFTSYVPFKLAASTGYIQDSSNRQVFACNNSDATVYVGGSQMRKIRIETTVGYAQEIEGLQTTFNGTIKRVQYASDYFPAYESYNTAITGTDPDHRWTIYHSKSNVRRGLSFWSYDANGTVFNEVMTLSSYGGNQLYVNGNLLVNGGITMRYSSDRRLKSNPKRFDAHSLISKLGGVYEYDYTDEAIRLNPSLPRHSIGFIAQNVEQSFPWMVSDDDNGYKGINYIDPQFISLLAASEIQTISQLKVIEKRQTKEEQEIKKLKMRIAELERLVAPKV